MAITVSLAEKANASLAGNNKACLDGESGEDKHSDDEETRTEGRSAS